MDSNRRVAPPSPVSLSPDNSSRHTKPQAQASPRLSSLELESNCRRATFGSPTSPPAAPPYRHSSDNYTDFSAKPALPDNPRHSAEGPTSPKSWGCAPSTLRSAESSAGS